MKAGLIAFGILVLAASLLLHYIPAPLPTSIGDPEYSYKLQVQMPKLLATGGLFIGAIFILLGVAMPQGERMPNAPYDPWRVAQSMGRNIRKKVKEHLR